MTVARLVVVSTLLGFLLVASPAPAAGPDSTRASMASQMRWAGAASGALVVDLTDGTTIYSSRPDSARVPASVEKLYTTAASLIRFGPGAQLQTSVLAPVAVDELGVAAGDLYLRGSGDPTLTSADLRALASDLVATTGLVEVTGRVIGDESMFDSLRGPPSSRYRISSYVGPLSALIVDGGRSGKRSPYWQARPALHAAEVFHEALRDLGISVGARPRAGLTPDPAITLATHVSPTMAELARRANSPSDNHVAEQLLKALGAAHGASGSTASGAEVARETLAQLGLHPQISDGSGLGRANRTTPRQVVRLLEQISVRTEFPAFRDSLAVAGRTGTLHDRMRRSAARDRCRGKTGTLISVSALAGYCQTRGGELVAYAFLMNRVSYYGARRLQDRMLDALARYDAG
jgi:D-alanyl-D-alanine carboxypeptidase/D-alanyl-D-alanine-endopeptidase (penicillin-binding protein 4)